MYAHMVDRISGTQLQAAGIMMMLETGTKFRSQHLACQNQSATFFFLHPKSRISEKQLVVLTEKISIIAKIPLTTHNIIVLTRPTGRTANIYSSSSIRHALAPQVANRAGPLLFLHASTRAYHSCLTRDHVFPYFLD